MINMKLMSSRYIEIIDEHTIMFKTKWLFKYAHVLTTLYEIEGRPNIFCIGLYCMQILCQWLLNYSSSQLSPLYSANV